MRYYIADPHFFGDNLSLNNRGFASVAEMNEYMVEKWNVRVRWNDEVYILGDFSSGTAEETHALLRRLRGQLTLITGNHDRFLRDRAYDAGRFQLITPYTEIKDNSRKVILCHYPIICYNGQHSIRDDGSPAAYMLYGHIHDTYDQRLVERFRASVWDSSRKRRDGTTAVIPSNLINCYCGYSDYTPLTLDEWILLDRNRMSALYPWPGADHTEKDTVCLHKEKGDTL